jgi:hypothetical protein
MHEHTSGVVEHHTGPRRRKDELVALERRLCMSEIFTLLRDCGNEGNEDSRNLTSADSNSQPKP